MKRETPKEVLENAKYRAIHCFVILNVGMATEEEFIRTLSTIHRDTEILQYSYSYTAEEKEELVKGLAELFLDGTFFTEKLEAFKKHFAEMVNPLTIEAATCYYCTDQKDREKAKELYLKAYEEGDFYAGYVCREKGYIY